MTLPQMRYFIAVCQYGNITKAAESLHITQPSVSNSIRELEDELKVNLFHRVNKRLSLTNEGAFFREKTAAILEQIDHLTDQMRDLGEARKQIAIGVPPMIGTFLFPSIFDKFHESYPEIELNLTEHGSQKIRNLILSEEIDVAIAVADKSKDHDFHIISLQSTELLYCVSPAHIWAERTQLDIKDLEGQPMIRFKDDSVQYAELNSRFAARHILPKTILASNQLYTIKKMIARGKAGAFLFREIADMETELVGIPLTEPICMEIGLIWKRGRHVYSDTTKFIQFIKALPQTD